MGRPRVEYMCNRCGYATSRKSNYTAHVNRKTACSSSHQCDAELECDNESTQDGGEHAMYTLVRDGSSTTYMCKHCQMTRKTYKGIKMHLQSHQTIRQQHHHISKPLESDVEALRREIQELRQQINSTQTTTTTTTINNINNGVINNNKITINAFGKENLAYIQNNPNVQRFVTDCIKQTAQGVCEYMVRKHFNPLHPENHNLRKMNKKDEFIEYFDGSSWKINFCEELFKDIFENLEADFQTFIDMLMSTDPDCLNKDWLDRFMEKVGMPLDWDLDCACYEFTPNKPLSEQSKADLKHKIYQMACEYIYRHSCEMSKRANKK
jgi:hypothetical protein